ncbi:MAG TPA: cytochrome c peroxidase [Chitinophagaceae bacterium]|nr:cytochrome c peroxidase [Chitinophagaceae bacterium]
MKKTALGILLLLTFIVLVSSFSQPAEPVAYKSAYKEKISGFRETQQELLETIRLYRTISKNDIDILKNKIHETRSKLKELDFWLRYLEPVVYKKINGPLPVEWETEVFEKFEAPYKREGGGLTLAELYLDEKDIRKDSLETLVNGSIRATQVFLEDSITQNLNTHHHFFLANRLFLLNLAAVYTTGFECPDTTRIIPEMEHMLKAVEAIYKTYDLNFPAYPLKDEYLALFEKTIQYVRSQPSSYSLFDHLHFIQHYINPLYRLNHNMILDYKVRSTNYIDYSLDKKTASIFDKSLYRGQNAKGVFIGIDDETQLSELKNIGKLLFYDPILSLNNKRSCASCHNPATFFTDTTLSTHLNFDGQHKLARNTPSLINAVHNQLVMIDGKHISLEDQSIDVITNPDEMGSNKDEVLKKIMSCDDYKKVFKKYLAATPQYASVNMEHIASAIILYYSEFSFYYSSFDHIMNERKTAEPSVKRGFNLFMGKAQCGTCHFVPQFNGSKPPYTSSEFEVLGVPADTNFKSLSPDKGRYMVNPAKETYAAFRTASVRNTALTKPYMHNGIFKTLESVIDFYDGGGGIGRGLVVNNQTLSSDSLKLTGNEKKDILAFINSLNEDIPLQLPPARLPVSKNKALNSRVVGGEY